MTDPFPVTSIKSGGLKSVLWTQTPLLINYKSYKMKQRDKITEKQKKVKKNKLQHCRNNFKQNIKIAEKGKIDTTDTKLSWLGTDTLIKMSGVNLV